MADALQDAPLTIPKHGRGKQKKTLTENDLVVQKNEPLTKEQIVLSQKFDTNKKYMFELAKKNPEREQPVMDMSTKRPAPHKEFIPFRNIVYTSQIVWNGDRRILRYYDGCKSIFSDEQPKDRETIEQLIKQTKRRGFQEGKFGAYGDERMLLLYMTIASWNSESEFRTRSADAVWIATNRDKQLSVESQKLDDQMEALKLAQEATEQKMFIHANYLGVPLMDYDSGNEFTTEEVRVKYRKQALRNPSEFISSYGNKKIELKYFINKALEQGLINNKFNKNKATWANSNTEICDISGLRSNEAISDRLFEFACTEEGEEFEIQLRALFS